MQQHQIKDTGTQGLDRCCTPERCSVCQASSTANPAVAGQGVATSSQLLAHTCGRADAKREDEGAVDGCAPQHEHASPNDVLRLQRLGQRLPKVHNHAHGLDEGGEEELPMGVELVVAAPAQEQGGCRLLPVWPATKQGTAHAASAQPQLLADAGRCQQNARELIGQAQALLKHISAAGRCRALPAKCARADWTSSSPA